jgi:hypothetical protein
VSVNPVASAHTPRRNLVSTGSTRTEVGKRRLRPFGLSLSKPARTSVKALRQVGKRRLSPFGLSLSKPARTSVKAFRQAQGERISVLRETRFGFFAK